MKYERHTIYPVMEKLILFGLLSIPSVIVSWRSLFGIRNHGLYRFLSWECIIWLVSSNYKHWFKDPASLPQVISWLFLIASGYFAVAGAIQLKKHGKPSRAREDHHLYHFEKTTMLVDQGIFKYIRHPLYSSLLFLTWGIFLKNITWGLLAVSLLSTLFLFLTSLFEEKECEKVFGVEYKSYMQKTKRFIPFIF